MSSGYGDLDKKRGSGPTVIPGTDPDEVVKARLEAVMTDVREEILDRLEREQFDL